MPLVEGGEIIGVINVHHREPHRHEAQAISSESYLERILQAISEMLAETMESAVCSILLVDAGKKELTVSALFGAGLHASDANPDGRLVN